MTPRVLRLCRVVGGAALVGALIGHPSAASAQDLHVSAGGADGNRCTQTAPCRSFARAYAVAQPGQVVEVSSGSYGEQSIPALGKAREDARVTFQAAGDVNIGGSVAIRDSYVTLRGPIVPSDEFFVSNSQPENPIRGVHLIGVRGPRLWVQNTRGLVVRRANLGNSPGVIPVQIGAWPESYDVLFDSVRFHDNPPLDAGQHLECLFAVHVQGMTVRNSLFENCSYFNILASECCGGHLPPRDLVLENNVFRQTWRWDNGPKPTAPYSVLLGDNNWGGQVVFRNNLFETPVLFNGSVFVNPARLSGNVGSNTECYRGVTYRRNVWENITCGGGDRKARRVLDFFDSRWRLQAGSPAINAGDPDNAPAADRDGQVRDQAPDAGPDEFDRPPGLGPPPGRIRALHVRIRGRRAILIFRLSGRGRVRARLDRRQARDFRPVRKTRWRTRSQGVGRVPLGPVRRGRYRVRVTVRDAAGNTRRATVRFRVPARRPGASLR